MRDLKTALQNITPRRSNGYGNDKLTDSEWHDILLTLDAGASVPDIYAALKSAGLKLAPLTTFATVASRIHKGWRIARVAALTEGENRG